MTKVLVLSDQQHLRRQLLIEQFQNIEFVFDTTTDYDYIAVIDSVEKELICKVPTHKRILYIGEPPFIKPFPSSYLAQYGLVVGPYKLHHPHFKLSHPVLPWLVGNKKNLDATFFQNFEESIEKRLNKFCIITSNKRFTQGHRKRVAFVERVKEEYPDLLDIYGMGYQPIEDKFEVLSKYKYCLAIENCICPNYWTEKIGDAFLTSCIPFYYGCPNIDDFFPKNSFVYLDITHYNQAIQCMQKALRGDFDSTITLEDAKKRILFNYNVFERIKEDINFLETIRTPIHEQKQFKSILSPYRYTLPVKIKQYLAWKWNLVI